MFTLAISEVYLDCAIDPSPIPYLNTSGISSFCNRISQFGQFAKISQKRGGYLVVT